MTSTYRLTTGHIAILDTLTGLKKKYGKDYVFPAQLTLLKLLKRIHKIRISRRTLNYWLRDLEDVGLIKRYRRFKDKQFLSTNYYVGAFSKAAEKVRKIIGYAKRLKGSFPVKDRVQKTAHYINTQDSVYADGSKKPPSSKGIEENEPCQAHNIERTEETGENRELFKAQLSWLREGTRLKAFGKEPDSFFGLKKQEA